MSPFIREIKPEEFEETYELITSASEWLRSRGIEQWEIPISKADFQAALLLKEVFVLLVEGRVAGSVTLSRHKDFYWGNVAVEGLHLHRLVVGRDFKGQAFGEFLLRWSKNFAAESGLMFLRLDCRSSSIFLREYYLRNGFIFKGIGQGTNFKYALFEITTR